MKNLILSLICIFAVSMSASYAGTPMAFKKGDKIFNPSLSNLGFNSISMTQKGKTQSMNRIGLQATGGYAIKDDILVIGTLGFQGYKSGKNGISLFDISAGAKYYFTPNIHATGSLLVLSGKTSINDTDDEGSSISSSSKIQSIGLRLGVGYTYFLTEKFAVEPSLTYDLGLDTKYEGKKIDIGILSLNVGFIIKL